MKNINILQNDFDCFGIVNDKVEFTFPPDFMLDNLADRLVQYFDLIRHEYRLIRFSLNQNNYENLDVRLSEIGIQGGDLINVEFETYLPPGSCSVRGNTDDREVLVFELDKLDKLSFILGGYLARTEETGASYLEVLEYISARTESPIEKRIIQQKIEEIGNLTQSYRAGIIKIMESLFIL